MNNVLPLIDYSSDTWILPSSDTLSDYTFQFEFLPNEWFKETIKKITRESIIIGRLKLSTLHRYNYSLIHFFDFVKSIDLTINTFDDVTYSIIEEFLIYLLHKVEKPKTRNVCFSALKHHIKYGQLMEWGGFPLLEMFDGRENRILQSEDILTSRLIDDRVMLQIDLALKEMKNTLTFNNDNNFNKIVLWTLITVIRHTGIRLDEALRLNINSLHRDLLKKFLLEVNSQKNETDRFIPIGKEVADAIEILKETTEFKRLELNTDLLFLHERKLNNKTTVLSQRNARVWLNKGFIKKYNITDQIGEFVNLTYHQFRHNVGTDLLNNGMSPFEVMQYLGHKSMHSTRLYAKVRNDRLAKEYKKIGFIGVIKDTTDSIVDNERKKLDTERRLMAQLPDGVCGKPIDKKVINCKKPNACLFCPKFITTPEFLFIHKEHLERIREDKERYMAEDLFGNDYLLFETEKALEEIISRLETIQTEVVK